MSDNITGAVKEIPEMAEDINSQSDSFTSVMSSPSTEVAVESIAVDEKERISVVTDIENNDVNGIKPTEDTDTKYPKQISGSLDSMSDVKVSDQTSKETSIANSINTDQENSNAQAMPLKTNTVPTEDESDEETVNAATANKVPSSLPTSSAGLDSTDSTYAEHLTYEADGCVIYTDPITKFRYKWCTTKNNWLPCSDAKNVTTTTFSDNPYENEHYKWCSATKKWIPKVHAQTTETEHYKWDVVKGKWIPKLSDAQPDTKTSSTLVDSANVIYDIDEDGQRIYTDKDGTVFFWDTVKNAWFPKIDDDFMARYQMNYGFIDNTTALIEEKRRKAEEEAELKELDLKRLTAEAKAAAEATAAEGTGAASDATGVKRKAQEPPKWFDLDNEHNTKVYVSNLPLDITMEEFAEVMGKCGMIMRDPQTQKYKLKLYAEPDGQLKGDGLCDYIKVESVGLALNILDEYNLRGHKLHVQRAKFQMRGEYNPALKPKRKKKDKEKLQKIKEKLFDWRPEKMRGERTKNEKVVIIKNLFEPSIFEKEVQLILDYQNDLREECSKCGTVRKVVVYDRHPEGVAQINMADPEEADVVIQMMHGRFFGQRQLSAEHWDGKTKYKIFESEAEVQKRLTNWNQYLTQEESAQKEHAEVKEIAATDSLNTEDDEQSEEDTDIGKQQAEVDSAVVAESVITGTEEQILTMPESSAEFN